METVCTESLENQGAVQREKGMDNGQSKATVVHLQMGWILQREIIILPLVVWPGRLVWAIRLPAIWWVNEGRLLLLEYWLYYKFMIFILVQVLPESVICSGCNKNPVVTVVHAISRWLKQGIATCGAPVVPMKDSVWTRHQRNRKPLSEHIPVSIGRGGWEVKMNQENKYRYGSKFSRG